MARYWLLIDSWDLGQDLIVGIMLIVILKKSENIDACKIKVDALFD